MLNCKGGGLSRFTLECVARWCRYGAGSAQHARLELAASQASRLGHVLARVQPAKLSVAVASNV